MGSMFAASPNRWTGIIALVFVVNLSRKSLGSRLNVSKSMSAKTTVAPRCSTTLAVEIHVKAGTITSSPGPTPRAAKER